MSTWEQCLCSDVSPVLSAALTETSRILDNRCQKCAGTPGMTRVGHRTPGMTRVGHRTPGMTRVGHRTPPLVSVHDACRPSFQLTRITLLLPEYVIVSATKRNMTQ